MTTLAIPTVDYTGTDLPPPPPKRGVWVEGSEVRDRHWTCRLESGLTLIVVPRPGFVTKAAKLTFRVGSTDLRWREEDGRESTVPAGSAHFLEHQLFKKADGDLSEHFDRTGANVNAYTSHEQTAYHFEGISEFDANLRTLCRIGFEPFFDPKLVEIERGIIEQELRRYEDDAQSVVWNNLLEQIYHNHPIKHEIVGTHDTLARISAESLAKFHRRFYTPANACLIVAGDIEPEYARECAERASAPFKGGAVISEASRLFPKEPKSVAVEHKVAKFPTTLHQLLVGHKIRTSPGYGLGPLREMSALLTAVTLAFGPGTDFNGETITKGLTFDGVSFTALPFRQGCLLAIGSETPKPAELEAAILGRIDEVNQDGFKVEDVERLKRRMYGGSLMAAESPEAVTNSQEAAWHGGFNPYDAMRLMLELTMDEIAFGWHRFAVAPLAVSLLSPRETKAKRARKKK